MGMILGSGNYGPTPAFAIALWKTTQNLSRTGVHAKPYASVMYLMLVV